MVGKPKAIFGLLDCNNFYVSCERVFKPILENYPVVVLSNNDGCIVSRSNTVKALKIPMGTPVFKIKNLIKKYNIQTLSSNYTLYGDLSNRVMNLLAELVPSLEVYSIDEAFIDFTGIPVDKLKLLADQIVKNIYQWTSIPVSIGIGPTKTLAKLANHIAKKNRQYKGVYIFSEENSKDILENLSIEDIWGIRGRWTKKLNELGISNAYQLSQQDPVKIRNKFSIHSAV